MLLTALILGRIFRARQHAIATLGEDYGKTYTGVVAILIESAAPYAILGFVFIVLYGLQNSGAMLLLELFVQVEVSSLTEVIRDIMRDLTHI